MCSAQWNVNWADLLSNSACKTFDLQGYKAYVFARACLFIALSLILFLSTIFVRRRPDNELMLMFFPVYTKNPTCLKADADLRAFNSNKAPVTPVCMYLPTHNSNVHFWSIFTSDGPRDKRRDPAARPLLGGP